MTFNSYNTEIVDIKAHTGKFSYLEEENHAF